MIHGFDNLGRQFDKNKNLRDWWGRDTKLNFLKKAECLMKQYTNYTVKETGFKVSNKL